MTVNYATSIVEKLGTDHQIFCHGHWRALVIPLLPLGSPKAGILPKEDL